MARLQGPIPGCTPAPRAHGLTNTLLGWARQRGNRGAGWPRAPLAVAPLESTPLAGPSPPCAASRPPCNRASPCSGRPGSPAPGSSARGVSLRSPPRYHPAGGAGASARHARAPAVARAAHGATSPGVQRHHTSCPRGCALPCLVCAWDTQSVASEAGDVTTRATGCRVGTGGEAKAYGSQGVH